MTTLDERILTVLTNAKEPLTPQQIAHLVGYPKPNNKACHVNPTLYLLLHAGKVEQQTTDGRKPTYTIAVLITQ